MFLDQFGFIYIHQLPLFDNELSANDGVIRFDGVGEDGRGNGIVQRACVVEGIQFDGEEVGAFANLERANVRASENICTATSGEM